MTARKKSKPANRPKEMSTTPNSQPTAAGKSRWWIVTLPIFTSIVALVISFGNLLFVIRTFSVTQRPYIGIATTDFQTIGNPPSGLAWKFTLTNAGTKPARARLDKNVVTLTNAGGKMVELPQFKSDIPSDAISLIMPGESVTLVGRYVSGPGSVPMSDILSGAARLDFTISISYTGKAAFGKNEYSYFCKGMMNAIEGIAPYFVQLQVQGD